VTVNVLFVCLGNICRSPTAHAVFQQLVEAHRLQHAIRVDSAGTGDWHIGAAPDQRATAAGAKRGYDLSVLRARQIEAADFQRYQYILAMDQQNLRDLHQLRPADYRGELALLLNYAQSVEREVPDPYYGAGEGFERVLDLVEQAANGLLQALMLQYGLQSARH
jgi:low molecular weight protein-tyrosine phosphatase